MEVMCQCCKTIFDGKSHNKKFCPICEEIIDNIENNTIPKEIEKENYFILNKFNIEKYNNDINGGYIYLIFNIKDYVNIQNDFIIKYFYKKCCYCGSYVYVDARKGTINGIIESCKNNLPVTCSRTCQNRYKAENGVNFICKHCGTTYHTFNFRIYDCPDCIEKLNNLYKNIFKDTIFKKELYNWIKDKNIIKYFQNDNGGSYYHILCDLNNYGFDLEKFDENRYMDFYYKVCKVCGDLIMIKDHIDRIIYSIENFSKTTFCSITHSNDYRNKKMADENLIKCNCKRCKNDFMSNNQNTYYCEKCNDILSYIYFEINENIIYDKWFDNKLENNEIEIIEEFKNEVESEYKIIRYKDFELFLKKCFKCNRWIIQDHYNRTIKAIKDNKNCFCSSDCRDLYYKIGFNYLKESKENKCIIHKSCNTLFYDQNKKYYVCWECFKEQFENNSYKDYNIDSNKQKKVTDLIKIIPKNLQCKNCGKPVERNENFCSQECNIEYIQNHNLSIKENNNCKIHKDQKYSYGKICLSCYLELCKENENFKIPSSCKCINCGKLINPYSNFCNKSCEINYENDKNLQFKHNNNCILHPNEELTFKNECWSCRQKRFEKENNFYDLNEFLKMIKLDYSNAFIQTTFRTQDSIDWSNAKEAFEYNLIEKNIKYFTYIKFYIKNNNSNNNNFNNKNISIKPLVVGKSGSKLVNVNGSDVNFSENINDGPARRFLKENNYEWLKTTILIIPCNNESEAFDIEKQIHYRYNLFYS